MNPLFHRLAASYRICFAVAILLLGSGPALAQKGIKSPDAYFGHAMGADRKLVTYDEFLPYLRYLAAQSPYVEIHTAGATLENRELVYLVLSSPDNLLHQDKIRDLSAQFNYPQGVTPLELEHALDDGKSVLLITANMHSDEIISSQMALEWAYRLVSGQYPETTALLNNVVVLLFPSANPDGQVLVADWYREYLGTEYEGSSMPWLYHRYAGHSINRDWFMLNLPETRAVNRVYQEWLPQVVVDVHQMGITGPRLFVPPYADPLSDRVHPLIYREVALFGANMSMQLEQAGKRGVVDSYLFDAYWPGGLRSTPWWKNTVGVLMEAASCRGATPVYVEPEDLEAGAKGLADYQPQVNFPNPWPGGWWRPRDILEYEMIALDSALETASLRRRDVLANRVIMSQAAMHTPTDGLAGFVIPRDPQDDPGEAEHLVKVLAENGVELLLSQETVSHGEHFIPQGSVVVPAAQPLRPFVMEMLQPHPYPEVRSGSQARSILRPYDVTAWTLPLMMGVTVLPLDSSLNIPMLHIDGVNWSAAWPDSLTGERWWSLSPRVNANYTAAWRLLREGVPVYQNPAPWSPSEADGTEQPAGSFWVYLSREKLDDLLQGLTLGGLKSAEAVDHAAFRELHLPRVGVYLPWNPTANSGWLNFVLETYGIPHTLLNRFDMTEHLGERFDVVVLPDLGVEELVKGHAAFSGTPKDPRPSPYNGGLGVEGVESLQRFVREGGTLVTLGQSSRLALTDFNLPVHGLPINGDQPDTPGVILETEFDPSQPLAYGMSARAGVFHLQSPAFSTKFGRSKESYAVAGWFPRHPTILSGWGQDLGTLSRKGALVEARVGKGRVVLVGFRPYFRGQMTSTYKILFNALLEATAITPLEN